MDNKVAIVVGGSKGLGLQITIYLLKKHYEVFVLSRTTDFIKKIEKKVPINKLKVYKVDLSKIEEIDTVLNKLVNNIQQINLIFNVTGSDYLGKLETINCEELIYILNAYIRGSIVLYKKILPLIKKSCGTHIFNFSVNWAIDKVGYESGNTVFTTTKVALARFFDSLISEYWIYGLSVTNLYLGELNDSPDNMISPINNNGDPSAISYYDNSSAISYYDIIELLDFLIKAKTMRVTDITLFPKEKGYGKHNIHYNGTDYDILIV